jgi:ADP-ribose pyrophosphatase
VIRPWKVASSEQLLDGRVFKVRKDVTINPRTGQTHDMYVLDQPNWVNVIPLTPDDHVVMVEQWRHGSRTVELETPGGLMDNGETPEARSFILAPQNQTRPSRAIFSITC